MEDGMSVWPDDLSELTGLRAADHGELDSLVMVLQKVGNVRIVGDGVDMHIGVALLPLFDLALQLVAIAPVAEGKHGGVPQFRLQHRMFDDGVVAGCIGDRDDDPVDVS